MGVIKQKLTEKDKIKYNFISILHLGRNLISRIGPVATLLPSSSIGHPSCGDLILQDEDRTFEDFQALQHNDWVSLYWKVSEQSVSLLYKEKEEEGRSYTPWSDAI